MYWDTGMVTIRALFQVVLNEYIPTKTKANTPEIRTGDHFAMLPYRFREPVYLRKVLEHDWIRTRYNFCFRSFCSTSPCPTSFSMFLYCSVSQRSPEIDQIASSDPHGNPESMNLYYNRPSSLSREIDLSVPVWDEGVFFRNMNRVLTIQSDQTSSRQSKFLIVFLHF